MGHSPHPVAPRFLRVAVLAAIAAASLVVACNKHKSTAPGFGGTAIADSLVFTRPDLTVVEMGTAPLVCCGLFDPGFVNERAMRIVFSDPPTYQKPGWQIIVLIDRAQAGAKITLPTVVVPPSRVPAVEMFVADLGNELSTSAGSSSGTITVHSFSCDASSIRIYFTVNAALGSELAGGPFMYVHGAFRATFPAASCP